MTFFHLSASTTAIIFAHCFRSTRYGNWGKHVERDAVCQQWKELRQINTIQLFNQLHSNQYTKK